MLKQLHSEAEQMACSIGGHAASAAVRCLTDSWESQTVGVTEILEDFDSMLAELISLRIRMPQIDGPSSSISPLAEPAPENSAVRGVLQEVRDLHRGPLCSRCASDLRIDGYCEDETCPFSDWPQEADIERLCEVSGMDYQLESGLTKRIPVCAKVYTDDRNVTVTFDAAPYFHQALLDGKLDQILCELRDCDFAQDYPADDVARFFEERETEAVFKHVEYLTGLGQVMGFECELDQEELSEWVATHAPKCSSIV